LVRIWWIVERVHARPKSVTTPFAFPMQIIRAVQVSAEHYAGTSAQWPVNTAASCRPKFFKVRAG